MKKSPQITAVHAPEENLRSWSWMSLPFDLSFCLEDEEATTLPRVFFRTPSNGDRIGTEHRIEIGTVGFSVCPAGVVRPNAGYLTVFVDAPSVAPGDIIRPSAARVPLTGGETILDLALDAGTHRLGVQAADGRGVALPISCVIDIKVVEPSVQVVMPKWGDTSGSRVRFDLTADGFVIEPSGVARPGAGHFFLVIDDVCPPETFPLDVAESAVNLAAGEQSIELSLSAGMHVVWLGVADGRDVVLAPRTRVVFYAH